MFYKSHYLKLEKLKWFYN